MNPLTRSPLVPSLTLLARLGAAGCVPIPHTVTIAPAIDGRFMDDDRRPVAGARVALSTESSDSTCANPVSVTTTDAEGRFAFAAIRHRERYRMLIGDWYYYYRLCAGTVDVFRPGFIRVRDSWSPAAESLDCVQIVSAPLRNAPLSCAVRPRASSAGERRVKRLASRHYFMDSGRPPHVPSPAAS